MSAKIKIVAVGRIKERHFRDTIAEYTKRLGRFCKLSIIEVEDEKNPPNQSETLVSRVLKQECLRLMPHIKDTNTIAMDVSGQKITSERFSELLKDLFERDKDLSFVIGGSLGLDKEILERSDMRLSMSDMTFPHQLARVMLIEQIYRAFKILAHEKYHK